MKRALIYSGMGVAGVGALLCVVAARYQPTVRPHTFAGPVAVGGLTPEEAGKKIRLWWEFQKLQKYSVEAKGLDGTLPELTTWELGVTLDDAATVASLPLESITESAEVSVTGQSVSPTHMKLVFRPAGSSYSELAQKVKALAGDPHPAAVAYQDGEIVRTPEAPTVELDTKAMPDAAIVAIENSSPVQLPLKLGEKRIPDEALGSITDVVSEFSTRFPSYNLPRCSNIRLASSRLNGHILMPGEKLSFNDTVGRRTLRAGFKLAGIYLNGKHDTGVGGGICQVSTTLYNASLLGNLRIRRRSNHSMPVAYVPLGRDATVDYGNLDLVIENSYDTPIAVTSEYETGRLTFRILGKKDPALTVKITTRAGETDGRASETQYVQDPTLPKGVQKVTQPGTVFRSILTFRKVYKDGKLVRTQSLGPSYYGGADQIIAVGTGKPVAPITPAVKQTPIAPPAPTPLGG